MAENEAEPWRSWLGRHGPALLLFARQWSASRADAEDAVQDGFLRFWRSRGGARDPVSYLYACVRTAAMDLGRGARRRQRRDGRVAAVDTSAFESPAERAERDTAVEAALDRLPGDQREVVVLKIWGGLTFAQIAGAVGVPPNTAASRYRYALARLGAELSEVRR